MSFMWTAFESSLMKAMIGPIDKDVMSKLVQDSIMAQDFSNTGFKDIVNKRKWGNVILTINRV